VGENVLPVGDNVGNVGESFLLELLVFLMVVWETISDQILLVYLWVKMLVMLVH
jgi:hypothetical protein